MKTSYSSGSVCLAPFCNHPIGIACLFAVFSAFADASGPLLLDTTFQPDLGLIRSVSALAVDSHGRILVGTESASVGQRVAGRLLRLDPDGGTDEGFLPALEGRVDRIVPVEHDRILVLETIGWEPFAPVRRLVRLQTSGARDSGFTMAVTTPNGTVEHVQPATDGGVWVSGRFAHVGNVPCPGVARLLDRGDLDSSFQSPFETWMELGPILSVADGRLMVAGNFVRVSGHYSPGLIRLNGDGSVDRSFRSSLWEEHSVHRLGQAADGCVLVGGRHHGPSLWGQRTLVRLSPEGAMDATFQPVLHEPRWSDPAWDELAVQPDGGVVVSGAFLGVNSVRRHGLARIQPDGSVDLGFDPGLAVHAGPVEVMLLDPAGRVLIGGPFQYVEALHRPHLARLLVRSEFDPPTIAFESEASLVRDDAASVPVNVLRFGDPTQPVSVDFRVVGGSAVPGEDFAPVEGTLQFAPGEMARSIILGIHRREDATADRTIEFELADPTADVQIGERDRHLVLVQHEPRDRTAGGVDASFRPELPGPVDALLRLPDGRFLVSGHIRAINGVEGYLILLDDVGAPASDFIQTNRFDARIQSLARMIDGHLLIGGGFREVNGLARLGLTRVTSEGVLDSSFEPFSDWDPAHNFRWPFVSTLHVNENGVVYGGGYYLTDGTGHPLRGLLRLTPDGSRLHGLNPGISDSIHSAIRSLRALPENAVLAAVTGIGSRLLKLDLQGNVDPRFVLSPGGWMGYGLVETASDGHLLVWRSAPNAFDDWHVDLDGFTSHGHLDPAFVPAWRRVSPPHVPPAVTALAFEPDGRVLIGGGFLTVDSIPRRGIARLHRDGSLDLGFDPGEGFLPRVGMTPADVNVILPLPGGGCLVGGEFPGYDGLEQPHLVRLLPESMGRPRRMRVHLDTAEFMESVGGVRLSVVRTGDASSPASVRLVSESGSAQAGVDFVLLDTLVEFGPGEWRRDLTMEVIDNVAFQSHRSFSVRLMDAHPDYELPYAPLQLTVLDDDIFIDFDLRTLLARESQGFALITLRRRASRGDEVAVPVQIGDRDFWAVFPAQFEPASDAQQLLVPIPARVDQGQATEEFLLRLGEPTAGASLGPYSTAVLTVLRDDPPHVLMRGVAGVVETMASDSSQRVYLAGEFSAVFGVPRTCVARLLSDGRLDPDFDPGTGPDGRVRAIALQRDGRLLIGGDFDRVAGVTRHRFARLLSDGTLDPDFDPGAGPEAWSLDTSPPGVWALAEQADGRILIGGPFQRFQGLARTGMARTFADGRVDAAFFSPFHDGVGLLLEDGVESILLRPDGRVLVIGLATLELAVRNTLLQFLPDGDLDPDFLHDQPDWRATAAALLPDGRILVAYHYPGTNGDGMDSTQPDNWLTIHRLEADGRVDPTFHVHGHPVRDPDSARVRQLLVQPDGRVLCRVDVLDPEGMESVRRTLLLRLHENGAWDATFNLVEVVPATNVIADKFNPAPDIASPFAHLAGGGAIRCMTFGPGDRLSVGGAFGTIDGEPRRSLASVGLDGRLRAELRLALTRDVPPGWIRLRLPPEINIPYRIEWSQDLRHWMILTEQHEPWFGLDLVQPAEPGSVGRFYRAVGID